MVAGENCKSPMPIAFHKGTSKLAKFMKLSFISTKIQIIFTISHQLCFEELWNVEDRGKDNDRQDVACHSCYGARWGRVVPDIIVFNLVLFLISLCLNLCSSYIWNSETISAFLIVSSLLNCACCFCIWQSYFCKKDSIWGQDLFPFWYSQNSFLNEFMTVLHQTKSGKEISSNECLLKL